MSMTFEVPPDVQAAVAGIADLDERVTLFLRHQAQLEALRRQRYSPQTRAIVAEAMRLGEADKVAGFDREESFDRLQQILEDFSRRM